ncbi:hypothetical protein N7528_007091 [Penicillium herquei]|nr:hypothetical protein N7528_007091 [Penicillium herquei]
MPGPSGDQPDKSNRQLKRSKEKGRNITMPGPSGDQPDKSNRQLKRSKEKGRNPEKSTRQVKRTNENGRKGRRKEERHSVKQQNVAGLTPRVKVVAAEALGEGTASVDQPNVAEDGPGQPEEAAADVAKELGHLGPYPVKPREGEN